MTSCPRESAGNLESRSGISSVRGNPGGHSKGRRGGDRMAAGQKRNTVLVPQALQALERFKYEIANEIAQGGDPLAHTLQSWYQTGYGGDIPARVWGSVGGNMVRRMIAAAEQTLVQ